MIIQFIEHWIGVANTWTHAHSYLVPIVVMIIYFVLGLVQGWSFANPPKLTEEEIQAFAENFAAEQKWVGEATRKALELGYDVTDLHFPDGRIYRFRLKPTVEMTVLKERRD